jgi:hypothetical protein
MRVSGGVVTTCERFLLARNDGTLSAEMLAHMRSCPACLTLAVEADPENLFRSLGGEIEPPDGVDQFVDDVMQGVRVRERERIVFSGNRRFPAFYRWAAAAVLAVTVGGVAFVSRTSNPSAVNPAPAIAAKAPGALLRVEPSHFVPVVESYDSSSATIIEVPSEQTAGLQVVMVFDESLPVDL